jgi:hypothetical protein
MALSGKGFMIWKIKDCEGGDPVAIANAASSAGLTHVVIKIADGVYPFNIERTSMVDLVPPVVNALHNKGIQAWGWHYVYGNNPLGEAQTAGQRVRLLGLDGYVIDAEGEYKQPGKEAAARKYMTELRSYLPKTPIALCSFRFPTYHPQLPWKAFLEKCDIAMPQMYWQSAHNPGAQLRRCVNEYKNLMPSLPVIPTGSVYHIGGWDPTVEDINEFLDTSRLLNLQAANFYAWEHARSYLKPLWSAIAAYKWPPYAQPIDIPDKYIAALNTHDSNKVISLYNSDAVHITAAQTLQGTTAIQTWLTKFLGEMLPNAIFRLTGVSGTGDSRHFTWQATSQTSKIMNGNDTVGLMNGKIAYHYSFFTVTKS